MAQLDGARCSFLLSALRFLDRWCASKKGTDTGAHCACAKGGDPKTCASGSIYFGDTGTAVTVLAKCYRKIQASDPRRAENYMAAMAKYWRYVTEGSNKAPPGRAANQTAPHGFVDAAGAVGCGYYGGTPDHVSLDPYTIATATTGAAFAAEYYASLAPTNPDRAGAASVAAAAVSWICNTVLANGQIPYILDGKTAPMTQWPLDTISYVTEGVVAFDLFLGKSHPSVHAAITACFGKTADWLVSTQNADGSWGTLGTGDQQRSPRVATLLAWYAALQPDAASKHKYAASAQKYASFLLDPANSKKYGVKFVPNTSGFVGIAVADMLKYGVTF